LSSINIANARSISARQQQSGSGPVLSSAATGVILSALDFD
jgi:hypothetical protein